MRIPDAPSTATPIPANQRPRALETDETADRHIHRFHVETGSEAVMLSIGGPSHAAAQEPEKGAPAAVPGGFAKFFNRVIDTGAWARLPDAARAVYMPLVRVADAHQSFRARAGVAALMRQTGLSRSSVKRGIKALQEHRLITVVRAGGVAADGTNRTNLYQLLVPEIDDEPLMPPARPQTAARAKRGARPAAQNTPEPVQTPVQAPSATWFSLDSFGGEATWVEAPVWPAPTPPGVRERTPSPSPAGPRGASIPGTGAVEQWSPEGAPGAAGTGATDGPLLRTSLSDTTSEAPADVVAGAKRMLEEIGVAPPVAADLARQHEFERIRSVVAEATRRQRSRRIRSAAGFAVSALAEGWEIASEQSAGGKVPGASAERTAREQAEQAASARMAEAEREAEDAALDAMDDQEWSAMAQKVLDRYADHPAMVRLLTRQPPRQCRLMRAEILALVRSA